MVDSIGGFAKGILVVIFLIAVFGLVSLLLNVIQGSQITYYNLLPVSDQRDLDRDGIPDYIDDSDGDGISDSIDANPYPDVEGMDALLYSRAKFAEKRK